MTFTVDRSTQIGRVRVLVPGELVKETSAFSDEDVEVLLSVNGDVALLAAAQALERIAADKLLLLLKVKVGTIAIDGPAVSDSFLSLAGRYRAAFEHGAGGAEDDIQIAELVYDDRTWGEAILNDFLRSG